MTGVEVAAFAAELALLAALALAGANLTTTPVTRIVLAIALPLAVATLWGRWLAPRASRRLPPVPGLLAKLLIFTLTSVLLAVTGFPTLAVIFWVVTIPVLTLAERGRHNAHRPGSAT